MPITTEDFAIGSANFDEVVKVQQGLMKYLSEISNRDSEVAFYLLLGAISSIIGNQSAENQMAGLKLLYSTYEGLTELVRGQGKVN